MTDKKLNVLDRILCVFRVKKEFASDIVSQADKVIENYIYNKNKLIHRKCSKKHQADKMAIFTAVTAFSAIAVIVVKSII